MFGVPVEKHGVNGHLRQKGKIAELALGYGGSVGALKAMGALEMGLTEEELQPLVSAWRNTNPMITRLWWDIDRAVKTCVKEKSRTETHGIRFRYQSGFLFLTLPSGRQLAYVKPRMGENKFGGEAVTYEGVGATKKWERLESYGPKFTENAVQAIARDILMYAMQTLSHCDIVALEMVRRSPLLKNKMTIQASQKTMTYNPTGSKYKALSADVANKHGFNTHGVIFDELHTQPNRKLFDVMTKGSGDARMQPLYFLITTAGNDTQSICYEIHQKAKDIIEGRKVDPTFYPVIYGAEDDDDWTDPEVWKKANPSIGVTVGIDKVQQACEQA